MEINKINTEIAKAFEDNKDLFKAFKEFRDLGNKNVQANKGVDIFELVNTLCKKSKRVMLFTRQREKRKEGYEPRLFKHSIGINSKGLGIIAGWSSQLSTIGERNWDGDSIKKLLEIFNSDEIFNELVKQVNKNSVKDLKKLRNYIIKQNPDSEEEIQGVDYGITITNDDNKEETHIRFSKDAEIDTIKFYDINNNIDTDNYYETREVCNILNREELISRDIKEEDIILEMKKLSNYFIDINLKSIKVFAYLFNNKKFIKKSLTQNIKMMKNENKALEKRSKFVSAILNPLKAVDNL